MTSSKIKRFPNTRIATIDVCEIGKKKHHVTGLFEIDITESRNLLKAFKNKGEKIGFNAWLLFVVARTLKKHPSVSSFLSGKRNQIIFDDINISFLVEKVVDGKKVPVPLLLESVQEKSLLQLTGEINKAKQSEMGKDEMVLQRKTRRFERLYYFLPGIVRRWIWKFVLKHPRIAFKRMGNVSVTSLGMFGKVNGWFIPTSIHPVCFGVSTIKKKAIVLGHKIEIREILNVTVLIDHDVVDGAQMVRFINEFTRNMETGYGLKN